MKDDDEGGIMKELLNKDVKHKKFGNGKVTEIRGNIISISFENITTNFSFPEVFKEHLSLSDKVLSEKIKDLIEIKEQDELEAQLLEEEKRRKSITPCMIQKTTKHEGRVLAPKPSTKGNIAFKLNYCDGGRTDQQIGFNGVCSDKIIKYNIYEEERAWCSNRRSDCYDHYISFNPNRKKFEGLMGDDPDGYYVCYESQILRSWRAGAGETSSGQPKRIRKAQHNRLAILTTILPYMEEEERIIFGLFLIDDIFQGDNEESGYVASNSRYRIKLSMDESKQMKFWNYYTNSKDSSIASWRTGLFRYLEDEIALRILCDVIKLKQDKIEKELAEELLNHFLKVNGIDSSLIMG